MADNDGIFKGQLKLRLAELENGIQAIEEQMRPLQDDLNRLREERELTQRHVDLLNGTPTDINATEIAVPRRPGGEPYWQAICDDRNWPVNGNSAHRVVVNRDRGMHDRIRHFCTYDKVAYPQTSSDAFRNQTRVVYSLHQDTKENR